MNGDDGEQTEGRGAARLRSRVVGEDEMFVRRQFESPAATGEARRISFKGRLALRLTYLESYLKSRGWPPLGGRVLVGDADGNAWGPVPEEWEIAWDAEGINPRAETLPPAPHQIETGLNFILRRAKGFGDESWAIMEAQRILNVFDTDDFDAAMEAAHALGELHEQHHRHERDLPAIRRKSRQIEPFKKVAPVHGKKRRDKAVRWQEHACRLAREYLTRHPDASRSEVAKRVCRQLQIDGYLYANGVSPAERTVRRAIQDVTPV